MAPRQRIIALTGAHTFLGDELIRRLDRDESVAEIRTLDVAKPTVNSPKLRWFHIDLTDPQVDVVLTQALAGADTVIHGAFLSSPTRETDLAHELEDVGTMHVLDACAKTRPPHLIVISTTLVYGASKKNPAQIEESSPLRGDDLVRDKVRAEQQVAGFTRAIPECQVTVLRFAHLLGPLVQNYISNYFSRPFAPVLVGHDPLMQFIHESDAVSALLRAVNAPTAGVFNIVGTGVLRYSTVRGLLGQLPLFAPSFVYKPLLQGLWFSRISDMPPQFLPLLRYSCVASGDKAQKELGFRAHYDARQTLLDFLGISGEDADIDASRAQG